MNAPLKAPLMDRICAAHNPDLAVPRGMVYQLWDDGEITLQKAGDLLWMRSLHMIEGGGPATYKTERWPAHCGEHGYIFCTREDAEALRDEILLATAVVA